MPPRGSTTTFKAVPPESPANAFARLCVRQTVGASLQREVLLYREIAIQGEALHDVADASARGTCPADHVDFGNVDLVVRGCKRAAQHSDRCCLPGTVCAKETEDLPVPQSEVDASDRVEGGEPARQVADFMPIAKHEA